MSAMIGYFFKITAVQKSVRRMCGRKLPEGRLTQGIIVKILILKLEFIDIKIKLIYNSRIISIVCLNYGRQAKQNA